MAVLGCDAGLPPPPSLAPPTAPSGIHDAATREILGREPGTLGPAFDGLALGQEIDQRAATAWLDARGIDARAHVRDGHLVSINLRVASDMQRWPHGAGDSLDSSWFVPALHQHATELVTEQGEFLQFDLEVPIDRWIDNAVGSVVPLGLVAKPLDEVERVVPLVTHSNNVDGHAHVWWIDSALAGAATATEITVREFHTYDRDRDTVQSHELHVELEASLALYTAIEHRLFDLFGPPQRIAKAVRWTKPKLTLEHAHAGGGIEHIELTIER